MDNMAISCIRHKEHKKTTQKSYLSVENGHDLFCFTVMSDGFVHSLRNIVQNKIQVHFIFLLINTSHK